MKKAQPFGLTNKISIHKNNFLKKSTGAVDYFLNRENERRFYEKYHQQPFVKVPTTLIQDWWGRWHSEMPYWPQATTLPLTKLSDSELLRVKKLIDRLHQLPNPKLTIFEPQNFLKLFLRYTKVLPELKFLEPEIDRIITHFYQDQPRLVISHNDLIRENFLVIDQEFFLIDFEFVSLNHPLFDYASFISEALNPNEGIRFERLLELDLENTKKLHDLILYQNFLWAHWAKYLYTKTHKKVYQKIMIQKIKQALEGY